MRISQTTSLALALSGGLCACQAQPDLEIRYETKHLQIATDFDGLCAGNLEHWESQITSLEAQLGTQVDAPVPVYIWDYQSWPDGEWCKPSAVGCYNPDLNTIYTVLEFMEHELIHAVTSPSTEFPVPFFDEGIADGLQRRLVRAGEGIPVEELNFDSFAVDRITAAHFMRWLYERWGGARLGDLLSSSKPALQAFEATYGMSMEAAQVLYFAEAPWAYPPLFGCSAPDLQASATGGWSEQVEFDCDDPQVFGGPGYRRVPRTVTLSERAPYAISTTAAVFSIMACVDAPIAEPIDLEAIESLEFGDVPPAHPAFPGNYSRTFPGEGETTVLDLIPGRYEIIASVPFDEDGAHSLTFQPN